MCFFLFQEQAKRGAARPETWIQIETPPFKAEADKIKPPDRSRRQIVQTERGEIVKQALPDAFLSERNQQVDRETVSREHRITMGNPKEQAKATEADQSSKKATPKPAKTVAQDDSKSSKQSPDKASDKIPKELILPLASLGAPILPKTRFGVSGAPKEWDDSHRWADGSFLPEDYVRGLKESERTALNTKEYVFYGYFQRIRERLDRAWVPLLRERLVKMYRMGRNLASDMDHITQVMVILNPQGEIVRVQVVSESGTRDLDEAAVHAFNLAGPFPNPPKGIIDPNGEIQIPWQFILKT